MIEYANGLTDEDLKSSDKVLIQKLLDGGKALTKEHAKAMVGKARAEFNLAEAKRALKEAKAAEKKLAAERIKEADQARKLLVGTILIEAAKNDSELLKILRNKLELAGKGALFMDLFPTNSTPEN